MTEHNIPDSVPSDVDMMTMQFLSSHRFIRPKLKKGKLYCDQCGAEFFANLPFFIVVDTANKELVCRPCNFKKVGSPYDEIYEHRKKQEQKQKVRQMEQNKAYIIADKLVEQLKPFCDKIEIAGSIRRKKSDVGDIEIVALPKMIEEPDGMFGDVKKYRSPEFVLSAKQFGKILKGDLATGRYIQIELPEKINLDLFIPIESEYIRMLIIRTGNSAYSKKIAGTWRQKGWCGTEYGLRLQSECIEKSKDKWICLSNNPTLPPPFKEEKDFFDWLGMKWIEPEQREI